MTPQARQRLSSLTIKFLPFACFAGVLTCFVIGAFSHYSSKEKASAVLTLLLFFIPLSVQAFGLVFLVTRVNWPYYFFNLFVTTICLGFCGYFWLSYFKYDRLDGESLQNYSYVTLIVILVLLLSVGTMTYAIMRPSSNHLGGEFCNQLNDGVRQHPFWAIMFFFTLFLGVAYLFGFSLAFHDKYSITRVDQSDPEVHRPALRMVNYESIDDLQNGPPAAGHGGSPTEATETPTAQPAQILSTSSKANATTFGFYFKSGEARLETGTRNACTERTQGKRQWNRDSSSPNTNEGFNQCNLRAISAQINEETKRGRRVRVTLIGHGDNEPVSRNPSRESRSKPLLHYLSNYELSEARAQNVRHEILQMFGQPERWHNIEWVILPASNEDLQELENGLINQEIFPITELQDKFTQDEIAKGLTTEQLTSKFDRANILAKLKNKLSPEKWAEESRIVLASIKPISDHVNNPRGLGLIDYMYFSIYTITTTGYGDIVPTTAYAKFVTSIANFCEVLFLVVFFNALISLKGNPRDPNATQVSPPVPRVPPGEAEMATQNNNARTNVLELPLRR